VTAPPWQLARAGDLVAGSEPATVVIAGRPDRLLADDVVPAVPAPLRDRWPALVGRLEPGDERAELAVTLGRDHALEVRVVALPAAASRHDAPARPDQVAALVRDLDRDPRRPVRLLVACDRGDDAIAHAIAATRALPTYSRKTTRRGDRSVRLGFAAGDGELPAPRLLESVRDAVASAIAWQDTPCAELGVDALIDLARQRGRAAGAEVTVVRGSDLDRAGLGGIAAVGRAAGQSPALVVLRHQPGAPGPRPCWIGKGVVFDSGGLSLKRPREMLGMKGDMSGAAAVLAAFSAAAELGGGGVDAVLCVAENAIGPDALRPDDIVTLCSGTTIEVTDTDCEGRLMLADSAAYAVANLRPDVLVDLATLTDTAVVATGHSHAAIVCDDDELERAAVEAGRQTGDLVHPLPHLPALSRRALASEVADLRNDPGTTAAGTSAAAQVIAEQLGDHPGTWLHVDMEGPARTASGRGTGFGVGLLLRCFGYL
jgi:probable aminopeptidase NPEPL1